MNMTSNTKRTTKKRWMGKCWHSKRYTETVLKMKTWTSEEEHCITDQKEQQRLGEDDVEQSLWLALLAGKVEALEQSSQSICESWRLKGHFPSSSSVRRGVI